jgi:hypothetical protein
VESAEPRQDAGHLPARLGATRLDAAQMTSRDIGIKRQVQLANVPNLAPAPQQNAKICVRHCSRDQEGRRSLPDYKRNFLLKTSIQQSSSPHASAATAKPAFTAKITKSDGCRRETERIQNANDKGPRFRQCCSWTQSRAERSRQTGDRESRRIRDTMGDCAGVAGASNDDKWHRSVAPTVAE